MSRKHPEKREQRAVKNLLAMLNIAVYDTSQPFRAAITAGVPDLLCFCTKRGFFVVEVKSGRGKQTPAQRTFQELCEDANVPYVLGGTAEVAAFLRLEQAA